MRVSRSRVRGRKIATIKESTEKSVQSLLKDIEDCSVSAGRALAIYLSVCVYGAITIGGVSDRQVALQAGTTLPIVGINVPHTAFVALFPIMAIALFVHFQIYHLRLEEYIHDLEIAGHSNPKYHLYPWFVTIGQHSKGLLGGIQKIFIRCALWASLPSVLILNAVSIIRLHEPWSSHALIIISLIGMTIALVFWWKHAFGSLTRIITRRMFRKKIWDFILWTFALVVHIWLILYISFKEYTGLWQYERRPTLNNPFKYSKRQVSPYLLLNLNNACLVKEPEHDYPGLYWADFHGRHFEGADLHGSVLKRSYLSAAILIDADLSNCILDSSNLDSVQFNRATLLNASMVGANLSRADFTHAEDLTADQLCKARSLYKTKLDPALAESVMLKCKCLTDSTGLQTEHVDHRHLAL